MSRINDVSSGILVPIALILCGIFYGIRLGFFHVLHPIRVLQGLLPKKKSGGVSSVKAVTLALAGTLGVGNIVGVSSAIALGGFGAIFWMWISALVAMILKYAEIVLAMRHRRYDENGKPLGATMYYILDFFSSRRMKTVGTIVSSAFAVCFLVCALTMGSMLQADAISSSLEGTFGISPTITGAVLCVLTFIIYRCGTSGILSLTNLIIPVMSLGYILISVIIIVKNAAQLPYAFELILGSAFSLNAAAGGIGGYIFLFAIRYGVMRGLVSNEAGCGTAPTAHAIADCDSPARQGLWGIFEVFVDTVILCTMTALVVILKYDDAALFRENYMMMTTAAFEAGIGRAAGYFLSVSVACFGFATIVCWIHYCTSSLNFLRARKGVVCAFMCLYCLCTFLGSTASSEISWLLSDLSMGIMTLINLCVIVPMWREVKEETQMLFEKQTKKIAR